MVVAGVDQQGELPIEQVGDVAHQVFQAVHGEGDMPAVEVSAVQHAFFFGVDQRVVVGAVQLGFDELTEQAQAVGQYAQYVGCAAQRVAILQTVQWRGRRVDGQVLAQPGGDLHLPRMRLGGE